MCVVFISYEDVVVLSPHGGEWFIGLSGIVR